MFEILFYNAPYVAHVCMPLELGQVNELDIKAGFRLHNGVSREWVWIPDLVIDLRDPVCFNRLL